MSKDHLDPFTRYNFHDNIFSGPLYDGLGRTSYVVSSDGSDTGKLKSTRIFGGKGEEIGMIQWPSFIKGTNVTFRGRSLGDFLVRKNLGLSQSAAKYSWMDEKNQEYVWKDFECFDQDKVLIATYVPPQAKKYDGSARSERASLYVNPEHDNLLDYILFTCLLLEMKRRRQERRDSHKGGAAIQGGILSFGGAGL